jgi:hypothetical protein
MSKTDRKKDYFDYLSNYIKEEKRSLEKKDFQAS